MEAGSPPLVAYARVSTQRQGDSGLGIDAQRAAVEHYARSTGRPVMAWYTEVESGRRPDRPELRRALDHARRIKGTLVVAKLDRLGRNVAFLATLMESRVPFVCCDNPHATPRTLHILAAVAEDEAKRISERTRAALAAAKARGVILGRTGPGNATAEGRAKGAARAGRLAREQADLELAEVLALAKGWRAQGWSHHLIAAKLNEAGHSTRAGRPWHRVAVGRLLGR